MGTVTPTTMAKVKAKQVFRTATGWATAVTDAAPDIDDDTMVNITQRNSAGITVTMPYRANRATTVRINA